MKLTTNTNVSVDRVMQGLGGPDEDRSGGFDRDGWPSSLFDTEAGTFVSEVYRRARRVARGRRRGAVPDATDGQFTSTPAAARLPMRLPGETKSKEMDP